jgi:hypothetical protein
MLRRVLLLLALLGASPASAVPLYGTKWGAPDRGTGAVISYSFVAPGVVVDEANYGNIPGPNVDYAAFAPDGWRTAVAAAFDSWAAVADLRFVEVADSGAPFNEPDPAGAGDIRFWGATADPGIAAWAYYPHPDPAGGDIFLNSLVDFALADRGGALRFDWVVLHEIGHALGLMHDSDPESAMYGPEPVRRGRLGPADIAAIRTLYGPVPVPAPASAGLLGVALLALGLAQAQRRQRRAA